MIRHVDGFDVSVFDLSGLPYTINLGIFAQGGVVLPQAGNGQSWWIFNTAFGSAEYLKVLDPQSVWIVNLWFRALVAATGPQTQTWVASTFYKIQDAVGTLFDLRQLTTGHVLLRGSLGETLLDMGPFPVGDWVALQVKVSAGAWTVKVNGVTAGTGVPGVFRNPDRFMHRWAGGAGFNLDHYVICDGTGTENNDFLPYPWRVDSMYGFATIQNAWTVRVRADALQCIYDHLNAPSGATFYPDGELGYLKPTAGGQRALFQMIDSPCVGRVLGLALSVVAKPTTGTPTVQLIVKQTAVAMLAQPTLGARAVELPGRPELDDYFTYQGISETQPEGGERWTDGKINEASWGVEADSADVHVTQIFVQKVTTTDLTFSYDCGGVSNYGF